MPNCGIQIPNTQYFIESNMTSVVQHSMKKNSSCPLSVGISVLPQKIVWTQCIRERKEISCIALEDGK